MRPTFDLPLAGVRLRPWHPTDAPALAHHANDAGIAGQMRDRFPHPYGLAEARAYLAYLDAAGPAELAWAVEVDGEAMGSIGLLPQTDVSRHSAEIGYWLGRAAWGRGIATAAVRALTDYGFAALDLVRVYALVFATNPASARVLEKAGYALEGRLRRAVTKHGRTFDALLYARVLA